MPISLFDSMQPQPAPSASADVGAGLSPLQKYMGDLKDNPEQFMQEHPNYAQGIDMGMGAGTVGKSDKALELYNAVAKAKMAAGNPLTQLLPRLIKPNSVEAAAERFNQKQFPEMYKALQGSK